MGGWRLVDSDGATPEALTIVDSPDREGTNVLRLDSALGGKAAMGYRVRTDPDVAACWVSAWASGPGAERIRPVLIWYGRHERTQVQLQRIVGEPSPSTERWRRIALDNVPVPASATHVGFGVTLASEGTEPAGAVLIDDVEIHFGVTPRIRVLVNQAGYEPQGSKTVIVLSNVPLGEKDGIQPPKRLEILDAETGRTLYQTRLEEAIEIPEWEMWAINGDASPFVPAVDRDTVFAARVYAASAEIRSPTFRIAPRIVEALAVPMALDFFTAQRSGYAVPDILVPGAGRPPGHLDDALTPDGQPVNAVGGWYLSGDYSKHSEHIADTCYALLLALSERPDLFANLDRDNSGVSDALEEAAWGIDYLERIQEPDSGALWGRVVGAWGWNLPHLDTDNIPGTGDERHLEWPPGEGDHGEKRLVAALALLGRLKPESGALERAVRLERLQGTDSRGYLELWRSRGDGAYQRRLMDILGEALEKQDPRMPLTEAEVMMRYVLLVPNDPYAKALRGAVERHMMILKSYCPAPFHAARVQVGIGKLAFCQPYTDPDGWYLGNNMQLIQTAIEATLAARLGIVDAGETAQAQINWILGQNPWGISTLEGIGHNVPRYHHRIDINPTNPRGAIRGALARGMIRQTPDIDRPWIDLSEEPNVDLRTNEPWLPLNARWLVYLASRP